MSEPSAATARERWIYLAAAALLGLIWLATLASRPLFNPDEGRYAEIPREMISGGDWVIPHLNGVAYIEKPPLQYWATALSYRLLGFNEFAARLYTTLTAFGTLFLVWLAARRLFDRLTGWRAAAVLSSMLMFVALGQLLTLDMSLTFYLTLSLTAFLLAQQPSRPKAWMLLAWAAAGLGVLTKGLVAAAIPVAVLILYSLYARDWSPWRRLVPVQGLALFLVITVPWHWLAARRLADFLEFFFVREHLARYLTAISDRQEPWWFFVAVFLAGSMPWTLSALRAVAGGWRRPATPATFNATLFLWIWVVFVGVFFSLSDSKLMPYILPLIPALAMLIASLPTKARQRDFLHTAILTVIAGVALGLASLNWPAMIATSDRVAYFLPLAKPLGEIALLLVFSGAFAWMRRVRDAAGSGVVLSLSWGLSWLLLVRAAAAVAPVYSGVELSAALVGREPTAPIYSVGTYDQSLTFYLQRTVTLVSYRGELDYGLGKAPGAEITDLGEFINRWSPQSQAFAVMEKAMFEELKNRGVPMRLLASTANRVVVARL